MLSVVICGDIEPFCEAALSTLPNAFPQAALANSFYILCMEAYPVASTWATTPWPIYFEGNLKSLCFYRYNPTSTLNYYLSLYFSSADPMTDMFGHHRSVAPWISLPIRYLLATEQFNLSITYSMRDSAATASWRLLASSHLFKNCL